MKLLSSLVMLLALACGPTTAPVTTVTTNAPPDAAAEKVELPQGMRTYYMVLLRRGPAWTGEDTPESRALGAGHMAHIEALAASGKLVVAGPFLGQTDAEDLAGIYVFDAPSLEATRALTMADPAVKAGRFVPEYLVWASATGLRTDSVAPEKKSTDEPANPAKAVCVDRTGFDFWLGKWEVKNPKGDVVGHNHIERAERGCALVERWRSAKGGTGTSINYVDPITKEWVQLWVDAFGGVIRLRGGLEGADMVLVGDYLSGKGERSLLRGRWTPSEDGSVRQHFEQSTDDGKTWKTWFDGTYRRSE